MSPHRPSGRWNACRRPWLTSLCLVASAVATAWWAWLDLDIYSKRLLVLAAVSFGALGLVVAHPALRRGIRLPVLAVVTVVMLAVVVMPRPRTSSDMWSYAMYGRIVVVHGESPYLHPPSDFPRDRWTVESGMFADAPVKYGPVFIAINVVVAAVGQDSQLAVRLLYQIGAALAVLATLLVMRRLRASPAALALVALNPIVVIEVVRVGRLDALIGLLVAGAVLLASRDRILWATVALTVATLMKLPVGIAFIGFVPWVVFHHGWRKARSVVVVAAAMSGAAYLLAGGSDALRAVLDSREYSNDGAIWVALRGHGWAHYFGDVASPLGPVGPSAAIAMVATLVVAAISVVPFVDRRVPVMAVALPIVAYLVVSPQPTAWYFCWVLPLVALRIRAWPFLLATVAYGLIFLRLRYSWALHFDVGERALYYFLRQVPTELHRVLHAASLWCTLAAAVAMVVPAVRVLRVRARSQRPAVVRTP